MTISPSTKQLLSGLAVAVAGAAATAVEQAIANPPFTWRTLLAAAGVGALAGLVHRLPALGTKEAVITSTLQGNEQATVQKVLDKENK
jgi:1-aminocyclopropane-1-carboxylate deaminase/D-cysteine desulfhydrase-like pyridoxal-dependent ACC family enzyme